MRLLLVDDEPLVCRTLGELLRTARHQVETAHNPRDALQALEAEPFDFLITDYCMPGDTDGIQLGLRAQESQSDLGVVLMSGQPVAQSTVPAGWGWVAKPFPVRVLLNELRRIRNPESGRFCKVDIFTKQGDTK